MIATVFDSAILEFVFEWNEGDRDRAREIAKQFIDAHRGQVEPIYSKYTLEQLVHEVDELRLCGPSRRGDVVLVEMWLLSEFPTQQITGEGHPTVKIPDVLSRSISNGSV